MKMTRQKQTCPTCGRTFQNPHGLLVHQRRMHKPRAGAIYAPWDAVRDKEGKPYPMGIPDAAVKGSGKAYTIRVDRDASRELPVTTENFFLWFLLRRGVRLVPSTGDIPALCAMVILEISKLEAKTANRGGCEQAVNK